MKNKFVFNLLIFIFLPFLMMAGNDGVDVNSITSQDWNLYKTQDGVQVFYKIEECHDVSNGIHKEIIDIKIVNTNSYAIRIQWKNELWYDNECWTCGNDKENFIKNELMANETLGSSCDLNRELTIFSKYLNYDNKPVLTKFELSNIKVIKK